MTKAKAKAERAAARLAANNVINMAMGFPPVTPAAGPSAVSVEDSPAPESAADAQSQPDADGSPATHKDPPVGRVELLRSKPEVVGRFMQLMLPILVDVYAASVVTPVRVKSLTGLLKAVSFLDPDDLKRVFTVRVLSLVELSRCTELPVVCSSCQFCLLDLILKGLSFPCHWCIAASRAVAQQGAG